MSVMRAFLAMLLLSPMALGASESATLLLDIRSGGSGSAAGGLARADDGRVFFTASADGSTRGWYVVSSDGLAVSPIALPAGWVAPDSSPFQDIIDAGTVVYLPAYHASHGWELLSVSGTTASETADFAVGSNDGIDTMGNTLMGVGASGQAVLLIPNSGTGHYDLKHLNGTTITDLETDGKVLGVAGVAGNALYAIRENLSNASGTELVRCEIGGTLAPTVVTLPSNDWLINRPPPTGRQPAAGFFAIASTAFARGSSAATEGLIWLSGTTGTVVSESAIGAVLSQALDAADTPTVCTIVEEADGTGFATGTAVAVRSYAVADRSLVATHSYLKAADGIVQAAMHMNDGRIVVTEMGTAGMYPSTEIYGGSAATLSYLDSLAFVGPRYDGLFSVNDVCVLALVSGSSTDIYTISTGPASLVTTRSGTVGRIGGANPFIGGNQRVWNLESTGAWSFDGTTQTTWTGVAPSGMAEATVAASPLVHGSRVVYFGSNGSTGDEPFLLGGPSSYTISYDANGGTGTIADATKTGGIDLTLADGTAFTRANYTFTGWNTIAGGTGTAYAASAPYSTDAAVTLYAQWALNTYTVTYSANGGIGSIANATKTHGVDLTLADGTAFTRTGHTFASWNTIAGGSGTTYAASAPYSTDAATTLYAQWTADTYTVAYDANLGTGTIASATKTYGVSLTLSDGTALSRTGHTFAGWNTAANGSGTNHAASATYSTEGAATLYAQWTLNTYAVTYDANGGTGSIVTGTKTYGVDLMLADGTAFTRTGYTFAGWNTAADGLGTPYAASATYNTNAAATLYARWAPVTYAVTYDANGGTGTIPPGSKTHGIGLTLADGSGFSRTGYAVAGWNTAADGTGTAYAAGATYSTDAAVTLYAQWTTPGYAVTYDANGATGGTAPASQMKAGGVDLTLRSNGLPPVVAWGLNSYGQTTIPAGVSGVTAIAAGGLHTVALKSDGTMVAWGMNTYGQTTIPAGLSGVKSIAAGYYHTVALKSDGTVVAWGLNSYGQATVPAGLSGVKVIAGGGYHTIALKNNGTVVAWGDNGYGQTTIPAGLSGVKAIAGGSYCTMALKNDGTVVAWGDNNYGQTTIPAGLSGVTAIETGASFHNLALKNDGTVVAWGENTYGQTTIPAGLSGVTAIAAGFYHNIALRPDPNSLQKTGFHFTGWNTAADGTGTHFNEGGTYTTNAVATMYAEWAADTPVDGSTTKTASSSGTCAGICNNLQPSAVAQRQHPVGPWSMLAAVIALGWIGCGAAFLLTRRR